MSLTYKQLAIIGAVLLLLGLIGFVSCGREKNQGVSFPDPMLEAAIRSGIRSQFADHRQFNSPIRTEELLIVKHIDLPTKGVSTMEGLQYCPNLETVFLSGNRIRDLTPLSGLRKLSTLDLADNLITDLSPLAGLKQLNKLDLSMNKIVDISPLRGLPQLVSLDLKHNQILDLTPLTFIKSLRELDLSSNKLSDISKLTALTGLTKLSLKHNRIRDIGPLVNVLGVSSRLVLEIEENSTDNYIQQEHIKKLRSYGVTVVE
ncbi:MAG: leucine-rich repeat domain-containing protein [Candidatus Wallbacteria bacterium]|nr:leucine-rich repeat domain-containing protein [Candidatus Wallbacteria bacterium]